jgi:hypothetical protein
MRYSFSLIFCLFFLASCNREYNLAETEELIRKVASGKASQNEGERMLRIFRTADGGNRLHFVAYAYKAVDGRPEDWKKLIPDDSEIRNEFIAVLKRDGPFAH